jgi:hypothetical protein
MDDDKPSPDYIRFDEIEDVVASVELVAHLAPLLDAHPRASSASSVTLMPVMLPLPMKKTRPRINAELSTSQGAGLCRFALAESRRNPASGSSGFCGGNGISAEASRNTPRYLPC